MYVWRQGIGVITVADFMICFLWRSVRKLKIFFFFLKTHSSVTVETRPQLTTVTKENNISLCGAVTLAEVRALLSEWLDSTGGPFTFSA